MRRNIRLKWLIYQSGKPQADLAQSAHMTESRLSRIVNGRAKAQDYEIKNLAHALGVDRKELPL